MTKNTIKLTGLLCACFILVLSCQKAATNKEETAPLSKVAFPSAENTIPLSMSIQETGNWRDYFSKISNGKSLKAFTIPMADVHNLAAFKDAIGVKAYLCLKTPGDLSSAHIILVPVDKNGKDILEFKDEEGNTQSSAYNLTQPCPTFCDSSSVLNNSGN